MYVLCYILGCYDVVSQYLPKLFPFLFELARNEQALIRSISCWTMSRYFRWVIDNSQNNEELFQTLLRTLLNCVLDTNKKVQEVACSVFATLEEEAGARLEPYVEAILDNLMCAFGRYQVRNMSILCDTIACLADAVTAQLNKPQYVEKLLPALLGRWEALPPDDKTLLPLLECLTSVAQALGPGQHAYS